MALMDELGLFTIEDMENRAATVMPRGIFNMVDGGASDKTSFQRAQKALDALALRPQYLVDVSKVECDTTVLGTSISQPILCAPTFGQGAARLEGELATARSAGNAGTIMILSHASTYQLEDVMNVSTGPVWAQIFLLKDRELLKNYIQESESLGCKAIVLTVDLSTIQLAMNEQDLRNANLRHASLTPANLFRENSQGDKIQVDLKDSIDLNVSWDSLDWVSSVTKLPVVVKGILRADDAVRATEHGAKGIIVSNLASKASTGVISSIEALPEIVEAVWGKSEVMVDGGFRKGQDILKALALGARAVCVGKPIYYALANGGEEGVDRMFQILKSGLLHSMGMCGRIDIQSLDRKLVVKVPSLYEPTVTATHWSTE
jgi:4-hydroxymandelate oxidase